MNEIDNNKDDVSVVKEDFDLIEEMKIIEQQIKDPNIQSFRNTTNWKQLNLNKMNQNQEVLLKEISECLLRIESMLQTLLKK